MIKFLVLGGLIYLAVSVNDAKEDVYIDDTEATLAEDLVSDRKFEIPQADLSLSQRAWDNEIKQCLQEQERLEKPNLQLYKQCLSKGLQGDFSPEDITQNSIPITENSMPCLQKHFGKQQYMPSPYTLMTLEQDRSTACPIIDRTEVKIYTFANDVPLQQAMLTLCMEEERFCGDDIIIFQPRVGRQILLSSLVCHILQDGTSRFYDERDDKVSAKNKEPIARDCYRTQDFWLLREGEFAKDFASADSIKVSAADISQHCSFDGGVDINYILNTFREDSTFSFVLVQEVQGWNGWCNIRE